MSWLDLRAVGGGTLVCPVRVLWTDYLAFCLEWGFAVAHPKDFVRMLRSLPGVVLVEGGRGRLRRCANGIGLRPAKERMTCM